MNKKNFLLNLVLVIILIILVVIGIFVVRKLKVQKSQKKGEVVLKEIGYQSSVTPVGFHNAQGILLNFIQSYNNHDGSGVAQIMNLVGTYIYSECENKDDFDKAYEEKLAIDREVDDIVIMQYSLQKQEQSIIEGVNNADVQLTLIENSEIEDKSKYLSKFTAKIRTVSEKENIDEIDTLEFILLHRDGAYYVMQYNLIASE
ncbi:MAG: hypothetical protein HFJ25_02350 [Clostridia bacterium]|nr:hypothetical protein [Clostridia bacterium]